MRKATQETLFYWAPNNFQNGVEIVDPDLSEFSFGYALTSEMIARFGLKRVGAPEFATQNAEGKKGGGWDMKLPGVPVFLQFKRSSKMVRRTAKEAGRFKAMPFYRMYLRRRDWSDQHQLMLDLEKDGKHVYYAAPVFDSTAELSRHYSRDLVMQHSIFVRPRDIGPLKDDKKHHVSFQQNGTAYFCSDPRPIARVEFEAELLNNLRSEAVGTLPRPSTEFFNELVNDLLSVYERGDARHRQIADDARELRGRRPSAEFAGLIARTLFDMELLVVPRESE